jgi:membrane-associated phospholipid phosphatase
MHQGTDENLANYFERHEVFHNVSDRGLKLFGGPGIHFAGASLWYALSADSGDDFNRDRAWTMIRALSLTSLTTMGLKAIRDNETPAGNRWAWPSGHTSSSFAVASVLDEFYGPKVGIPAYAAASLVGLRMMDQKDHWGSDVVFGATLGWVVGHTVAGKHKQLEVAGFKVIPYVASWRGTVTGITLFRQF